MGKVFFLLMGKLFFYSENWQVNFCFFLPFQELEKNLERFHEADIQVTVFSVYFFFDPPEECVRTAVASH